MLWLLNTILHFCIEQKNFNEKEVINLVFQIQMVK